MKAVVDRIVQYANRYQLTNVETGEVLGTFDFEEVTGTVQQVGTEIDKELFDSIANDLAARVKLSGGELAGTIVTFSDISGTAANVASGDTSATLWGKVKNWFSRLKALAFKDTISNSDVASNAAIAQSKVNGLESALATKANDADLATIAKTGNLSDATEDATHRVVTDTEKAAWNAKQDALTFDDAPTAGSANPVKSGGVKTALDAKANNADLATIAKSGKLSDATEDATHRTVTDAEKETWNEKQDALTFDTTPTEGSTNPVTSGGIKDVLDEKQETVTGGASTIVFSNLTESRALVSDASGKVAVSDVTATELGYLDGLKSNIQEQLDNISGGTGFVSTSPQTLTSEQQAQARSNIGAQASGNYALQDGTYPNLNTPKTLYNLGAYDAYTSNGDGTATITRKTGYIVINAEDCTSRDQSSVSGNYCCYTSIKPQNVGGVFGATIGVASNGYTVQNNNINFTPNLGIGLTNENGADSLVIRNDAFTDVSEYREICPIYVQFELATSYTEQVIENQPLNTLPQDGEQWARGEWEKGLNLAQVKDPPTNNRIFIGTVPAGTYTINLNESPANTTGYQFQLFTDTETGTPLLTSYVIDPATFTVSETTELYLYANGKSGEFSVMLNKGSHPYPYQPYNGEIVRTGTDETITGMKTFTQNVTISKRSPQLQLIDEQGRRTLFEVQEETGELNLIRRLSADDNVNDYVIQFLATGGVVALQTGDARPIQLNAESNNEANIAYGYNDTNDNGLLYVNYRGANDTIQGYRFCDGKGAAGMADIHGKNIYDNGVRVYSPNNPQPLRIATKVSGSNIDGGAAPSFSLSSGDYSKSMLVFVAKESNNNSTPFTSATVLPASVFGSSNTVVGVYRDGANMLLNVTRSGTTISIARRDTYFANYLWVYEIY